MILLAATPMVLNLFSLDRYAETTLVLTSAFSVLLSALLI